MAKKDTKLQPTANKASTGKKPRVRKTETVRDRTTKQAAKTEAKAAKQPKRRVRKAASRVAKPLKRPVHIITAPLRTRPMRAIGRFLSKILLLNYVKKSWQELKQVTWPSRRDTIKMTFAVLMFAIIFGLAAAGIDFAIDKVIRRIVFRA